MFDTRSLKSLLVAVVFGTFVCGETALAVNRFVVDDLVVPINSSGHEISVNADLDEDLYGFSISLEYERAKIEITEVQLGAAVAPLVPEWNDGTIDDVNGRLVWGVVFSLSEETADNHLTPGSNLELLRLVVDVRSSTATETLLNLANRTNETPVRTNVMTDVDGNSFSPSPQRENGDLTIIDPSPLIIDYVSNEGDPGATFFIVGENFDLPGLTVEVCDKPAEFVILDSENLQVTAPACDPGPALVELCNDFGCDSDPNGFTYVSHAPVITEFLQNMGDAGHQFFIVGENFEEPGTRVNVCGKAAEFEVISDDTISATAPECSPGPTRVEVCNDFGCASDPAGFRYPEPPGAPVITEFILNEGPPGTTFFIVGLNFEAAPNLVVTVCGVVAESEPLGDQITVIAPACEQLGWVRVEVCTDAGCDFDDQGFRYPEGGGRFKRGDSNFDGMVNIADAQFLLNFLFLGGTKPPCDDATDANDDGQGNIADAQYLLNFLFLGGPALRTPGTDSCGTDPTDDLLTECEDPSGRCQ